MKITVYFKKVSFVIGTLLIAQSWHSLHAQYRIINQELCKNNCRQDFRGMCTTDADCKIQELQLADCLASCKPLANE